MNDQPEQCPCGLPLHYTSPENERYVREIIGRMGEDIQVTACGKTYTVSRHYIALHGLKAFNLDELVGRGIARIVK